MIGRKPQPQWRILKRLKRDLLSEFAAEGVTRVEYVVAFSEPFEFWVWLGTVTDGQRDTFPVGTADSRIRAAALSHRMDSLYEGFTVESQETVDREYEGSWFYRLR